MKTCMEDKFFTQTHCSRCGADLKSGRIMSWFTDETICMGCSTKEAKLKRKLRELGKNINSYEGCGYIPEIEEVMQSG